MIVKCIIVKEKEGPKGQLASKAFLAIKNRFVEIIGPIFTVSKLSETK